MAANIARFSGLREGNRYEFGNKSGIRGGTIKFGKVLWVRLRISSRTSSAVAFLLFELVLTLVPELVFANLGPLLLRFFAGRGLTGGREPGR